MVAFHPPSSGKAADGTSPEDTTWIMARIVKSYHQDKYRYVFDDRRIGILMCRCSAQRLSSYDVEDIEPQEDGKPLYVTITIKMTRPFFNSFVP
jgi:hypothetical protein